MNSINICIIGGGSRLWAVTLMKDLSLAAELSGEIRLYDIDFDAAKRNEVVGTRIFSLNSETSGNGGPGSFRVKAEEHIEKALNGADFVIISIEPGPTEKRYTDLVLPEEFGILQSVGDTIGPGGIFRAVRAVPLFRDFAGKIMKYCPEAWVLNYTNPMTWCTNAMSREEPGIKVFGCCHEVFGTQKFLARRITEWFDVEEPHHKDIKLDVCGINHFTFALSAEWKGRDLYPFITELADSPESSADRTDAARERLENENWFESDNLIALDFLRIHGNLGAAGDRHLAEFVPWYLKSDEELFRFGVIRTPYEWRIREAARKYEKNYEDSELIGEVSDEEGVDIIRALTGLQPLYTNVNRPNEGQIPWIKHGHVVETNAYISRNSIIPSVAGTPSDSVKHLIGSIVDEQELVLDGLFEDREEKILQAFMIDPLVDLPRARAEELFYRMKELNDKS